MATYPPSDSEPRSGGYRGAPSPSLEDGHDAVQCATARAPSPHRLRAQSNSKSINRKSNSVFSVCSVVNLPLNSQLTTLNPLKRKGFRFFCTRPRRQGAVATSAPHYPLPTTHCNRKSKINQSKIKPSVFFGNYCKL